MKHLLFFSALILFCSCGDNANKNQKDKAETANAGKAKEFYDEAVSLHFAFSTDKDTLLKAVALLDSAIAIAPQYKAAYLNKQSCQIKLGDYKNALSTVKVLENLAPADADIKSLTAVCYLLNDDSTSAKAKLLQADSLWTIALDMVSSTNELGRLHILMNKGTVLKLLGKETEAGDIFKQVLNDTTYDKQQYEGVKDEIKNRYLPQSQKEFLDYLLRGIKSGTT